MREAGGDTLRERERDQILDSHKDTDYYQLLVGSSHKGADNSARGELLLRHSMPIIGQALRHYFRRPLP